MLSLSLLPLFFSFFFDFVICMSELGASVLAILVPDTMLMATRPVRLVLDLRERIPGGLWLSLARGQEASCIY